MNLKFASWFRVLSLSLLGTIAYLSIAFEVNSESSDYVPDNPCTALWLDLVSNIEELTYSDVQAERAIIFAGQDGRIFNCLDQGLEDSTIQELQFWEVARSRSIASDPLYEDSDPPNFCNSSYGSVQGIQIMLIHLPYKTGIFSSHACTVRLRRIPDRVKNFLKAE